jgi:hypothetical protein
MVALVVPEVLADPVESEEAAVPVEVAEVAEVEVMMLLSLIRVAQPVKVLRQASRCMFKYNMVEVVEVLA